MRWSPRASIVPPAQRRAVAAHDEAVGGRLDVGAEAAQALDHARDPVRLLEPQLLGAAHDGLALGVRAEQRHQRQLVDRERHLVRLDDRALERAGGHVELADRLARPPRVPGSSRSPTITAPMRSAIRKKPVRVQLSPTSFTTTREPRTRIAAATMNAADDGSPGTHDLVELELVDLRRPSAAGRRARTARARARSSRSVWSRLGAGSVTRRRAGRRSSRRSARTT